MGKSWTKTPVAALLSLTLVVAPALSQAPPAVAPAPAPATAMPASRGFTQEQLDQMLASIALYPDALLSQVLMASTYPLEVVEAARWSKSHSGLEGEQAVAAVADQDWDPSVKALVAFPRILARMDEDLDWTQRLGDAFLGQEAQVMETVQVATRGSSGLLSSYHDSYLAGAAVAAACVAVAVSIRRPRPRRLRARLLPGSPTITVSTDLG